MQIGTIVKDITGVIGIVVADNGDGLIETTFGRIREEHLEVICE